jgi:hypothetical protein
MAPRVRTKISTWTTVRARKLTHFGARNVLSRLRLSGEDEEIRQEDAWAVIGLYFREKGLVRQQLDSFDEFISVSTTTIPLNMHGNVTPRL